MAVWSVIKASNMSSANRIDADYFKPAYLHLQKKLTGFDSLRSYTETIIHPSEFQRIYSSTGISVLRAQNIRPFLIDIENNEVFLLCEDSTRLYKNKVKNGDILITRTGANFGQVALFYEDRENAIVTSHTLIIRIKNAIRSEYVAIFLNTHFGRSLINQGMYGSSQPEIAPKFLFRIPIPRLHDEVETVLADKYLKAIRLNHYSIRLYSQATQLLEKELRLGELAMSNNLSFQSCLSQINNSGRIDSQHFRPSFDRLISHLRNNFITLQLGKIVSRNRRGIQPVYVLNGEKNVINSQHITSTHLAYDRLEKTSAEEFSLHPEAHVQYGDILVYTTGAYIGQTNPYLSKEPALASNHVNVLRVKNDIDSVYLALVLNTLTGKLQTEQHSRGSAQVELYPLDLAKFTIPILTEDKMTEIGNLVRESLNAQITSKALIFQAKSEVETLIEQAAQRS